MTEIQDLGPWHLIDAITMLPTLTQGHDSNLKLDHGPYRVSVVRTGDMSKGLRVDKRMGDGTWKTVYELDAPNLCADEEGTCLACGATIQLGHHIKCEFWDIREVE